MKRKFTAVTNVYVLIATHMSLAIFCQSSMRICAAENVQMTEMARTADADASEEVEMPEKCLTKIIPLTSNETAQVPRYIVENGVAYVLDESSIVVEVTGNGSAEGADVVTFSKKVNDLSDNDLAGIEKETIIEGISCELLSAAYKVEEEDENGIPIRYIAVCEYGGLKKYSTSYPTAWRMTARYDLFETPQEVVTVEMQEEYESGDTVERRMSGEAENEETENGEAENWEVETGEEEKALYTNAGDSSFRIKPASEEEEDMRRKVVDGLLLPLAAATAGVSVTVPFIVWVSMLTAPLFGMKKEGEYHYIGRIRLKGENKMYAAYLTKRLLARAGIPVFYMKVPKRVWKNSKTGIVQIHCPGGKTAMATIGKAVHFTVEGD